MSASTGIVACASYLPCHRLIGEELAGTFDLDGEVPIDPDGGLKSFGHPVGASNLGGRPRICVSFISIVGKEQG